MLKTFSKILIFILFLFSIFIGYFTLVGFETNKFNNQIKENLAKIDTKLDVKLNDVKIVLDLFNLNINAKTLGSTISYNEKLIEIELIKSDISLRNLFKKKFSLSNLFISTKSVKLKDVIAFIRAVNDNNRAKLFVLENFIDGGYLIADISLNFDEQGNIKEDLRINGLVRDGSINLLNKKKISKVDFIFETQNKDLIIKDINFLYEKIIFRSEKIRIENKDKFVNIVGQLNNDEIILQKETLNNLFTTLSKIELTNLKFSSKNEFSFKINNKFKVSDLEIRSLINTNELILKNNIDLKNIFPNTKSEIKLTKHKIEIFYKNNNLSINGNGNLILQNNSDKIQYKIKKNNDQYLFDIDFNIIDNSITLDYLNYKADNQSKISLKLNGKLFKDNSINFKKIIFKKDDDLIIINDLKLTNDLKISKMKSANFYFYDVHKKINNFQIKRNQNDYIISGSVLNASKLIDDLIFKDTENKNIFKNDFKIFIDLKEVYLHKDHIVYDLDGTLEFKENNIFKANINSKFNEKKILNFTINTNEDQKVTTLFSDRATPFVQKFNFIKGYEDGSLDFYSIKSKNNSNSKIKIFDFKLKELPVLTKILTLASLQGIADLLSGDGISFTEFEMNFENKEDFMKIEEIYAIGPAISILMEGYIEKNKLISLRGTLVPATTINKVIGSIPIIGDILVGKKTGEGVFGVSFKIKGPPKKLETSVNPIKTLTPRFITRTLEKIKKN
tara:strand:+ start:7870 stop:10062 length:2193 start_codon:yes stop_codon:yes gene_type:complete